MFVTQHCYLLSRVCMSFQIGACVCFIFFVSPCCVFQVVPNDHNPLHQDPLPDAVQPSKGPKAGGTLITISGKFLDTGSKEDVQVTIGDVDCTV